MSFVRLVGASRHARKGPQRAALSLGVRTVRMSGVVTVRGMPYSGDPTDGQWDLLELEVAVPGELSGGRRRDASVHQDQLEPTGDALVGQVLKHQLAGSVLVGRGRNDRRGHAKHFTSTATLCALRAAVVPASVVEREPSVRGAVSMTQRHRDAVLGTSAAASSCPRRLTRLCGPPSTRQIQMVAGLCSSCTRACVVLADGEHA